MLKNTEGSHGIGPYCSHEMLFVSIEREVLQGIESYVWPWRCIHVMMVAPLARSGLLVYLKCSVDVKREGRGFRKQRNWSKYVRVCTQAYV